MKLSTSWRLVSLSRLRSTMRPARSIDSDATYIVITAYSDQSVFDKFQDIGVCAYLLKPIDFNQLFAALERCSIESKRQQ